jgi:hypothetical protein
VFIGKSFSQLLRNPEAIWMSGHLKMQNATTVMSNYKEAIKNAEGENWDGEEIHGGNCFTMVA